MQGAEASTGGNVLPGGILNVVGDLFLQIVAGNFIDQDHFFRCGAGSGLIRGTDRRAISSIHFVDRTGEWAYPIDQTV